MLLLATINKHDTFKCNCDWNVFPTHDKSEFHLPFVACTNVGLDFNTSGRRWRYKSSRKDGVISQLFYETHSPSVHVAMLDTACSKWHCRVTSLSKDVIYEDVCTVGGFFSVKLRLCTEPTGKTRMRGCRWGKVFYFFHTSLMVRNERNYFVFESFQSQWNVSGRSRFRGIASRGGLYYLFELVIVPDIIMFQILQYNSCVHQSHSAEV